MARAHEIRAGVETERGSCAETLERFDGRLRGRERRRKGAGPSSVWWKGTLRALLEAEVCHGIDRLATVRSAGDGEGCWARYARQRTWGATTCHHMTASQSTR